MVLNDDEMRAIGAELKKPRGAEGARALAKDVSLVKPPGAVDAKRTEGERKSAQQKLRTASEELARAAATVLSAKTHQPWEAAPGDTRCDSAFELLQQNANSPTLFLTSSITQGAGGALFCDDVAAQQLVLVALGAKVGDESAPGPTGRIGAGDKRVIGRILSEVWSAMASSIEHPLEAGRVEVEMKRGHQALAEGAFALLPIDLLGPVQLRLTLAVSTRLIADTSASTPQAQAPSSVAPHLPHVEVDVVVELGRAELTLEELLRLRPGDVLTLSTTEHDPLPVYVDGTRRAWCTPDSVDGRIAAILHGDIKNVVGAPMKKRNGERADVAAPAAPAGAARRPQLAPDGPRPSDRPATTTRNA